MKMLSRIAASLAICGLSSVGLAQEEDSIFSSLDANKDGLLVADEVSESQKRFFDRLLRAGDENEDGKLSKAEYQATLKEDEQPVGRPEANGRPGGGRGQFEPGAIFDRLDTNKDGKLTKSELPEQARDRMGRLFDELGKEEVTKEEYAEAIGRMMRSRGGQPGGRPGGEDFFKRLDKNGDGKVSKDEIPEQMRDRMAGLFERLGKDEIDLEELARMRRDREGDRPRGEGDRERPEMRRRGEGDGERRERDGDRPEGRRGERDGRPGEGRPGEGRPGMERGEGRPGMGRPGMGPGGPAFMRVLDENEDGRISKAEALNVAKLFEELDRNEDGQLDGGELMGFQGRPGEGREGMGRRPEGDRPPGDRPQGDRPRGDRPEGDRPPGGRPGFGPEAFIERFDENKDGSISKEEAPERMAENFDRLDENGDGKITAEEFGKAFRGGRPGGEGGRPQGRGPRDGEGREGGRPQRPEAE